MSTVEKVTAATPEELPLVVVVAAREMHVGKSIL